MAGHDSKPTTVRGGVAQVSSLDRRMLKMLKSFTKLPNDELSIVYQIPNS